MKFFVISFLCSVTSIQVNPRDDYSNRNKRQDDRWNWGYVLLEATTTPSPASQTDQEDDNPCNNNTYSPIPDFSALRKGISETKCYEYIWEVKHRAEIEKRSTDCTSYRMRHRGPNDPHFAIGGRNTEPGEFPHMGAIGWRATIGTWVFKCGGSLISSKFVLTAAHCSKASPRDTTVADIVPKIIRLGDKNIIDKFSRGTYPQDANITRVIVHPDYASPKKYFDIALIELENEVVFTKYVQPACLWAQFDTSRLGDQATLTGWGVIESGSRDISPELQAAVVDVIDSDQCDRLLRSACNRNWCGIQEHQLCAGKLAGGVDACQGDSGGPLQMKIPLPTTDQGSMHYIIGVTSFGISCALPNQPGVYTRVSSFIDWIESIVWQ